MQRAVPILAAVVLIVAATIISVVSPVAAPTPKPPNIVVILVDTLRADYTSVYGHEPDTSPFLKHLSQNAAVFDRSLSTSSWTAPSVASVFTSLYPFQHGITLGFFAHKDLMLAADMHGDARIPLNKLSDKLTTLPELMKLAGYTTFGIAANPNIENDLGFAQGFGKFFQENDRLASEMYGKVRSWKREMEKARPYFLYLHLMDPHMPYRENSPYFERFRAAAPADLSKARYLSEVEYTDHWLERIFKLLRLDKNTLVVFLSDHGEEFNDHGNTEHGPYLYDELQHTVMMVYGPGLGIRPARYSMNVSLIDVLPTLAEFTGVAAPSYAEGKSLWPLMTGSVPNENGPAWQERVLLGHRIIPAPPYFVNWDATQGQWKYIEHHGRAPELYDHATDPTEHQNVAAEHPDIAQALAAKITAARGAPNEFAGESVQVPMDDELKRQLESLGYVDKPDQPK